MTRLAETSTPGLRLSDVGRRLAHIYQKEIWQAAFLKDRSLKGCSFAALRVISITITSFNESRVVTRAAALSFSTLLGLAPLLAIAVLVAGFALGEKDPEKERAQIAGRLHQIITLALPQIKEYESPNRAADPDTRAPTPNPSGAREPQTELEAELMNSDLVLVISNIIKQAQSGTAASTSSLSLLLIVLLLFKAIEDTFNDIWGVRQGRSVLTRIVFYWTILTLGAILFFTAIAANSATTFMGVFDEKSQISSSWIWTFRLLSFVLLAFILTLFYRVIPNTRVFWRAAFIGGLVVAALLMANNLLQLLYVKRVVMEKSFYGSLAIIFVLMFGLYVFWLCVLVGGIVSYAVQNVHFRNSQVAWSTLSEWMREQLALVVFLTICRRFRDCLPPIAASDLSAMLKVPTQLVNECLNRLVQLKLVTTVRPPPEATGTDYLYQPSRPLNRITLLDFKTLDDNFGENPIGSSFEHIDPLLPRYNSALSCMAEQDFFQKTLEELFSEHPFDESRPPFTLGERRAERETPASNR